MPLIVVFYMSFDSIYYFMTEFGIKHADVGQQLRSTAMLKMKKLNLLPNMY